MGPKLGSWKWASYTSRMYPREGASTSIRKRIPCWNREHCFIKKKKEKRPINPHWVWTELDRSSVQIESTWMTQMWLGSTTILPNSVVMKRVPCCGTGIQLFHLFSVLCSINSWVTNQKVAVCILHAFVVHGGVASVNVNGHSIASRRMTSSANGVQSFNEIHQRIFFGRQVEWSPPHLHR